MCYVYDAGVEQHPISYPRVSEEATKGLEGFMCITI